jgi:hypothetical protein
MVRSGKNFAKYFNERFQGRGYVAPTRVVKEQAGYRRTPILEHSHEARFVQIGFRDALRHIGDSQSVYRGLHHQTQKITDMSSIRKTYFSSLQYGDGVNSPPKSLHSACNGLIKQSVRTVLGDEIAAEL